MDIIIKTVLKLLMSLPWQALGSYVAKRVLTAALVVCEKWAEKKEIEAKKTETPVDDEAFAALEDAIEAVRKALEKV